jgi:adenine-specific DNA-methyltransferase
MEKLHSETLNIAEAQMKLLRELFPECVTEGPDGLAVDFDALRQALSSQVVEGPQERYRLDWPGKRTAAAMANRPTDKTLRPAREESIDFDTTQNLFIQGDNLEALKLIQETYLKQVKMIYIDPPYNTGRNLIYRNDFSQTIAEYEEDSGQRDSDGGRLVANKETNGRFHSDWLSMLYPRLKIAKNLLSDDGVLVLTIDENEVAAVTLMLREIFGEGGYEVTPVSITHNPRGIQGRNFSYVNEYALFVCRKGEKLIADRLIRDEEVDWTPLRNWGGESKRSDAKNCFYPIIVKDDQIIGFGDLCKDEFHPAQTEKRGEEHFVYPIDTKGVERKWRYARQTVEQIMPQLRAKKTKNGYDIEIGKTSMIFKTVWTDSRYDANQYGTQILNSLIDGCGFTFPKSLHAVSDTIRAATNATSIVLDLFAGSATTAHAVMQLNAEDGGNRRFIMVQIPEACPNDTEAFKNGFETIAEISKERIRRAGYEIIQGKCHSDWKKDIGFRVFKVDETNLNAVRKTPDATSQESLLEALENIKSDRSEEDLLFDVMLRWGVDLTAPIERQEIDNKMVFLINKHDLVACFAPSITEDFVKLLTNLKPLKIVFRDDAFSSDAVKINTLQIFKQASPDTEVRSI